MSDVTTHVVLIEDEKQIRKFLRMTLESEGMSVTEADTGKQGLKEASEHHPDLILLDLGLPDMDGIDVIRQLRTWSSAPILILSARNEESQKVLALDSGADDYLTKPFGVPEMMARIRVHLRKHGNTPESNSTTFSFGEVKLDFAKREVIRNGLPVHLTPTEYKLLSALVRNVGKVVTHTQLLREVWGQGHMEHSHYLRVYMGHLRQKLEADPTRPSHIFTETGVGYRLIKE